MPPEYHEAQHQDALKEVGPCAQRQRREDFRKGVGNAGDGGDSRAGVEHQHNAETVDEHRD